jgi:hypothetical protein
MCVKMDGGETLETRTDEIRTNVKTRTTAPFLLLDKQTKNLTQLATLSIDMLLTDRGKPIVIIVKRTRPPAILIVGLVMHDGGDENIE